MTGPCYILVLALLCAGINARVMYNSQLAPPSDIRFADMTGDGLADFLLFQNDQVFVTTTENTVHGISYLRLPSPATRLIHGKFIGGSKEVMCAQETAVTRLDCYTMSPVNTSLIWSWYQYDFIGTRQAIVGDFNGDGRDDIMTYNAPAGTFAVYTWNTTSKVFVAMAWTPGNLGSGTYKNYQVRAGAFDAVAGTDLAIYNPTGQAWIFYSTYNTTAKLYYMKKAITTTTGFGGSQWEFLVANLNGDTKDDVILHNTVTGQYLFYNAVYDTTTKKLQVLKVDIGAIHQGPNSRAFFAKLQNVTNGRDDVMVYSNDWKLWIRADARLNKTVQSYTWAYTQYPLILNSDQDGDSIKTIHELGGYDPDNDGVSDGILISYGASPFLKDIFVHADYMEGPPNATYNYLMNMNATALAVSTLAGKSINLHVFPGTLVAYKENLGNPGFNFTVDVFPIRDANFPATRVPFFHYCLFACKYGGGTSSGVSNGIVAQEFIVTLGGSGGPGSTSQQAGTFLHELGHNMGLRHGSKDNVNYKPNHISIMNYNYQFQGIYKNMAYQLLYSDIACSNLTETALVESKGVQCVIGTNSYYVYHKYANVWSIVNTAFNWDRDGVLDSNPVSLDVNNDTYISLLVGGVNEFNIMVYNGGSIGSIAKRSVHEDHDHELVAEPPIEDLPTSEFTFKTDFSEYNLKPHTGPQVLQASVQFPTERFASAKEAVVVQPVRFEEFTEPPTREESRSEIPAHERAGVSTEVEFYDGLATPAVDLTDSAVNPDASF